MKKQKLFCLVGPSGSGKNHFQNLLINKLDFAPLVSSTTREMRAKETEGVEYYFVDEDKFNSQYYVQNNYYANNWYGLDIEEFINKVNTGKNLCVIVTYEGVIKLRKFLETGGLFYRNLYFDKLIDPKVFKNLEIIDIFINISVEEAIRRVLIRDANEAEKLKRIEQIVSGETKADNNPQYTYESIFNIYQGSKYQEQCDAHFIEFVENILKED